MKYNIGDKVIVLDMSYFSNAFHYEKEMIKEYEVKDADERYFSPFYNPYDKMLSGINLFSICRQEDGKALYGGKRYYHKEKDRELILDLINQAVISYDEYCSKNDSKRIKDLREEIKQARIQIKEIESGNGSWKIGFSERNNKEYKGKVLAVIQKIIPLNKEQC